MKEAKQRLDRERDEQNGKLEADDKDAEAEPRELGLELDAEVILARVQGREGWLLEARRQTDERRAQEEWPGPALAA